MCGIVGYVGEERALPILIDKLTRLAYRGYDSAGIAVLASEGLYIAKSPGPVDSLVTQMTGIDLPGTIGLGHTRWATHGEPNYTNAHPHTDCTGRLAVVQNGIIENYHSLKRRLQNEGHTFKSATDTEVIPHLIEKYYEGSLEQAVRQALQELEGSFALLILHSQHQQLIAAKRDNPPIIIGVGRGGNHVASDMPSLLQYTNKVYVLEDGEYAVIDRDEIKVDSFVASQSDRLYDRALTVVEWSPEEAGMAGYAHYMLKEIYDQPTAIRDTLRQRLISNTKIALDDVNLGKKDISNVGRFILIGCGTAFHACSLGKYLFESHLRRPVELGLGSEYRYSDPVITRNDFVIAISQSGETADTLACVRHARALGARTLAITNVVGSAITRLAEHTLYTRAGPEISVASTKAFTAQIAALNLLLVHFGYLMEVSAQDELRYIHSELQRLPDLVEQSIERCSRPAQELAYELVDSDACFFIGRNLDEPMAREGALKVKEIGYIQAHGYAAGELKHGTFALLTERTPVIAIATQAAVASKMVSNIEEVLARHAPVTALVPDGESLASGITGRAISVPRTADALYPALVAVPLQLIAYYAGVAGGHNVDQPRNLAKSVTVE